MSSKISSGFFPRNSTFKRVLASSSPRRIELMAQLGWLAPRMAVLKPDVDESVRRGESARKMVARLARDKAETAWRMGKGDRLIISADTTVVLGAGARERVLGKPRNAAEARRMLGSIQGREHVVLTGYCILACRGRETLAITRVVRTRVRIRKLSRAAIAAYVRTGEPMDKAGAYAAQGIGAAFIESIAGSYTNVVGLPIAQLAADLEAVFGVTTS